MRIIFVDRSNRDIQRLVKLCSPSSSSQPGLLLTPPFNELLQGTLISDSEDIEAEDRHSMRAKSKIKAHRFKTTKRIINDFVVAVDSGVVSLGQLVGSGTSCAFAIRGAAICYTPDQLLVLRYNTGALLISPHNKVAVFRYIGERLGKPDLYVTQNSAGQYITRPSAADTINQMQDRCRNFVERIIQEEALGVLAANNGGILLIDGALAISYDTPRNYLRDMLMNARRKGIDICAISKRSSITIGGIPIDTLFDPYPTFVGYAPLMDVLETERQAYEQQNIRSPQDITEGTQLFVVRFGLGPPGLTFRVDTFKSFGSTDEDILNDVYNKCPIYGGYPKPLIDVHQYSAFLGGDTLNLLADLVVKTNLRVKEQPSMGVLFEPFGSFGK